MGRGDERLFLASGSQERWPPSPYMVKNLQKSSPEPVDHFDETWYVVSRTPVHHTVVCSNDDPGLTLTYLTARSKLLLRFFL